MTPCSASSDRRRCGPDCQRRVSWLGRPPSPRTLTAKPSLTPRLRVDGAAGPGAPIVRLVVVLAGGGRRVGAGLRTRGGRRQEALLGRLGRRGGGVLRLGCGGGGLRLGHRRRGPVRGCG